jgi:hypothetical protein
VSASSTVARQLPFTRDWGGNYKNCIGGPGKTDWDSYGEDDFPFFKIVNSIAGIKGEYTIRAPNDVLEPTENRSLHIANHFNSVSHTHSSISGGFSSTTAPYPIEPLDDLSGSPFIDNVPSKSSNGLSRGAAANDNYTFTCLDPAEETIHRIKVYIREWDTYASYLAYITSSGATVAPDNPGTSPTTNCEGLPGPCNDFLDFDNFVNSLPGGAYSTAVSATGRAANFPSLDYK